MKSRSMKWVRYVARTGEMRNTYKILVEKSEGKKQLLRSRLKWEDNIKICFEYTRVYPKVSGLAFWS
jgi:hypothetical protein